MSLEKFRYLSVFGAMLENLPVAHPCRIGSRRCNGIDDVRRTYQLVVLGRMVFGPVVSMVSCSLFPVNVELALTASISKPVEPHVHGFRPALLYVVIEDTGCTFIVELEGGRTLRMTHFLEHGSNGNHVFGV